MSKKLKICVDFDGTVVEHMYPKIGKTVPESVNVLKRLVEAGHRIILYTMRSDEALKEAIDWYKEHDIPLFGINYSPGQKSWTNSPKIYGNIYIDDAALGTPLLQPDPNGRPYVDWYKIETLLIEYGALPDRVLTPEEILKETLDRR